MSEWVDVRERLPVAGRKVLARVKLAGRRGYTAFAMYWDANGSPYLEKGWLVFETRRGFNSGLKPVTYWMEEPDPPADEADDTKTKEKDQ